MRIYAREIKKGDKLRVVWGYTKVESVIVRKNVVYVFTRIGLFSYKPDDKIIVLDRE